MHDDYLRQIQRGIDFIEDHLDRDFPLSAASRAAGMSHWHFQRIFKAMTHETLKTYVRARRLAMAHLALVSTNRGVLDIALEAGFDSQASFTRAFKRAFGVPPAHYRKFGDEHLFLDKLQLDANYLRHIQSGVSLEPVIKQLPRRRMLGLQTRFYSVDSERNNIAATLPPLWGAFLPRIGEVQDAVPGTCYGVVRQAEPDEELLEYTAAIEIAPGSVGAAPKGMVELWVPAAEYAEFTHRGDPQMLDQTVSYIYSTWLTQSGRRHTYGPDVESYGAGYSAEHPEASRMGYAIPLKALEKAVGE